MGEELIEEVDWTGAVVSVHPKSVLKQRMFPHRVSLVLPRTADGKLIICRRAKDKHPYPDTWVCGVGGKAIAGETEEETAKREMQEEAGASFAVQKLASFAYNDDTYKALFTVFTTKDAISSSQLTPNPEEIQYFATFSLEELKALVAKNPGEFAPTFRAAVEAVSKN